MPLTNIACKNAKPSPKYASWLMEVVYIWKCYPAAAIWRMKYRFEGKEKRLAFGVYPDVTLDDAREQRSKAKKILVEAPLEFC